MHEHRPCFALHDEGAAAEEPRYLNRGLVQRDPAGGAAFLHRVWRCKYSLEEPGGRAVTHVTQEASGARVCCRRRRRGSLPELLSPCLLPPATWSLSAAQLSGEWD